MKILCFAFTYLLALNTAFGFESQTQFDGLSTGELDHLDWPHFVDPEYSSDLLAYMPTLDQEYIWERASKSMLVNVGSLSSKEFYINNSLKLKEDLHKNFKLGVYYYQFSELEEQMEASIIEFKYKRELWGLGVYGEAAYHKAENDIGVALEVYPESNHHIRIFHTWTDFERHKRNRETDEFVEKPLSYGLSGLWLGNNEKKEFFKYAFRKDAPVKWSFPATNTIYTYQYFLASIKGQVHKEGLGKLSFRSLWDDKKESKTGLGQVRRKRHLNLLRWQPQEIRVFNWQPQFGIGYQWRKWKFAQGKVSAQEVQPHIIFISSKRVTNGAEYQWRIGYESSLHNSYGSKNQIQSSDLKSWESNHRANLWWDWIFSKTGTLSFTITLDLDKFGSDSTWEGGAGHLAWAF